MPENTESTSAFIAYNTALVDRDGYEVLESTDEEGNVTTSKGELLGKEGFRYYQCGTVSARGANSSATTVPPGQGRIIEMDLGVTPSPSTLPGDLNDFDKIFQIDKVDPNNSKSWLLTILSVVKEMTARIIRVTGSLIFGSGENEKPVTDVATSEDVGDENMIGDTILASTAWVSYQMENVDKKYLRKDKDDRSTGKISTDKALEVGKFVAGASGAIIQIDKENGQTIAELDKLYVRMKAYFETLEIINVNTIGGKMILSPAGSVTCLGVEELDDAYRCYFLGEQDGEIIENRWVVGMQAYSQMFNAKEGVSNKVSNTYYWRLVTEVSGNTVEYNNQKCHYIDLSKTDCDSGSDIPKAGDVINHRGCRNDVDYMNFIEFSSVGTNAPYITLFQGVDSYSLVDKEYVSFGYDQSTGRSYMNVYGDMYFGNRDGSSFLKYNPEDGLEVKGKLSVGSTYNGNELGALFDKQQEDLEKFTEAVTKEFENIRNEMDGAIDTWFGEETPTLENYPAVDWITDTDKDSHLGDLFYANDGKAYRFQYDNNLGVYYWAVIEDSEVIKALELAQKALDTADGKRRVFIEQPYPPYDLGDLWAAGESQPLGSR